MISQRSRYALKALIHLARLGPEEARSVRSIAEEEQIPPAFLEQIMADLKRAGFIVSRRGKEGGYRLARPSREFTLANVLRQIDGPVAPLACLSKTAYRKCDDCADEASCALRIMLADTHAAVLAILETRSLADALARADLVAAEKGLLGADALYGAFI